MDSYYFDNHGEQIGKFWFDQDSGTLKFEGKLDETVAILMDKLKSHIDAYIKEQKKRGPYKKRTKTNNQNE